VSADSEGGLRTPLAGRVALVTGASQGIGRAIALELARFGVQVHAVARDRGALEALAKEAPGLLAQPADLGDDASVDALVARLADEAAAPDLLVHSAGTIAHATTAEAEISDLDLQLAVNLRGPYRLTQALLPRLIEGRGDVVFVNSSVTQFARDHSGQFAATQHALIGFANSLREELNPAGVRVLTVYPGKTATPRQERLHRSSGSAYRPEIMLQPEDVAEVVAGALALPRRAEVTEIRIRPAAKG
jgi:NAD(P)-dependent dehydrogenase (short-subunit alcohol dehydrogenase family)